MFGRDLRGPTFHFVNLLLEKENFRIIRIESGQSLHFGSMF